MLASGLSGQPRRLPPNLQTPDQLDPEEGASVLAAFRQVRPVGDLVADFQILTQPYRGEDFASEGRLYASWAAAPVTRVEVTPEGQPTLRWLFHNGPTPQAWQWTASSFDAEKPNAPTELAGEALRQPLLPGIELSPFEVLMPFIYWEDYVYEGTRRVRGRASHFFLLYPPADSPYATLGGVRVVLDADFNALLSADLLSPEGEVLKSIQVRGFKKVNEQWIVKRIDLVNRMTRDRTRFELLAASVGSYLPSAWFSPQALSEDIQPPAPLDTF